MIKISRYTRARLLVAWWKAIIILSTWNCNITFGLPHADVKRIYLHKSQCDLKFSSFQAIQNYRCSCQSKMKFPINYAFWSHSPWQVQQIIPLWMTYDTGLYSCNNWNQSMNYWLIDWYINGNQMIRNNSKQILPFSIWV